jgi:DNA repair protein RadC
MAPKEPSSIRDWPSDLRPRERLLKFGAQTLNDAELLAIFIRTGSKGKNALELSYDILQHCGGFKKLLTSRLKDFDHFRGMGLSKWSQLQAVQEIVRRAHSETLSNRPFLESQASIRAFLQSSIGYLEHEVFACFFIDSLGYLIEFKILFRGSAGQAKVYPREIVKEALQRNASSIIFAHNHPNNLAIPSTADLNLTKQLKNLLNSIEINVLDHFIVTKSGFYSILDGGHFEFDSWN